MSEPVPDTVPDDHPVVLFDGVCNLCERSVQFLIRRDPEGLFRFAPLQSDVAETLLADADIDPTALNSVVLVDGTGVYTKSNAVLRIGTHLGGWYRPAGILRVVPRSLRDRGYDVVGDRRYDWFGKKESCMMPTPDIRSRFLAGGPGGE